MISKSKYKILISYAFIAIILAFFEIWSFRNIIFGGYLVSSSEDGLLAVLMNEHWFKVLQGKENWTTWSCLYPAERSVAYNDMYILHAIFYCIIRFLGFDKYVSISATIIILHIIGTALMYVFFNIELKYNKYVSLIGVVCFSYSSYYLIKMEHCQFLSMAVIPLFLISISRFFKNLNDKNKRKKWAIIAVAAEVMLFYTSPYMAIFVIIATIVFVLWMFVFLQDRVSILKNILLFVKDNAIEMALYIIWGIVLMIPFCYVYLPLMSNNSRSFGETLYFMASWKDVFNVKDTNFIYGKLMDKLGMQYGENNIGFPMITWIVFLIGSVLLVKRGNPIFRSACATAISLMLITIKIGEKFSLWALFYYGIPGASGIRVVCRLALLEIPFFAMVIAWLMNYLCNCLSKMKCSDIKIVSFLIFISLIFFIENCQKIGAPTAWEYRTAIERDNSLNVPPPDDCKVFFAIDSSADESHAGNPAFYRGCVDAWLLADMYNIKTVNGFASYLPPGYGETYNIYTSYYYEQLNAWLDLNQINDIYQYDFATKEWTRYR